MYIYCPDTVWAQSQPLWWKEVNALRLWMQFPNSIPRPVIVLLHYKIVGGVVLPQSRHQSQVCGGRLTWHINCYLPRWMELTGEQWPDIASDRLRISPIIFLPSFLCTWCQLLLPLLSYLSCQRFSGNALLSCVRECTCVHIRVIHRFQQPVYLAYYLEHLCHEITIQNLSACWIALYGNFNNSADTHKVSQDDNTVNPLMLSAIISYNI